MENDAMSYYQKGKDIVEEIEKYTDLVATLTGEEKETTLAKISELKEENDKLKDEIYIKAKEKSGLDYSKEDKNPEILRKQYTDRLEQIKKRKQQLRLEKRTAEKAMAEREKRIDEQFKIASEKYKMMLDAGKITQELYDSRMNNMNNARVRDRVDLEDPIIKIKREYSSLENDERSLNNDLQELEKKEITYNEYGDVYYRLFGEVLADRNKMEKAKVETKTETKENTENVVKETKPESVTENRNNVGPASSNGAVSKPEEEKTSKKEETAEEQEKKQEPDVIVTGKKMFDELYKKMKKGTITDKEMNALVATLEDTSNYDKYGITTGLVFNKAKKILKYQGGRTAKRIEKFLRENGSFSDDIKFNVGVEKDNVISHEILNSWKNIDEKLTYTDAVFSVEKYIEQIEKYKESGAELTKEQEQMLKDAMDLKKQITSYRKAINTNEEIGMERTNKTRNSAFYKAFSKKAKSASSRALPKGKTERTDPGFIVMDLSDMVNAEPAPEEITSGKKSPIKKIVKSGPSL